MKPITQQQKQAIHALVSQLKWTRLQYEQWLDFYYQVDSCMSLSELQASDAIKTLLQMAQDGKITEKQVSYIKFLWLSIDFANCEHGNNLLNNFLQHRYGIDSVEKLSKKQAFGAIAAIKKMQDNKTVIKIDKQGAIDWVTLENGTRYATRHNSTIQ